MPGETAVRGRRPGPRALRWLTAASLCLCAQCRWSPEPEARGNYVTVRLNDSLSRFDSVVVQVLASGDTAAVVGTVWSAKLDDPGSLPSFRLADGETRDLSIRVRAWDATGRLALDERIAHADGGKSIVTAIPLARPSPRLASLALSAGALSPAFDPGATAYSASVPYSQGSIQVTASPVFAGAQLYVGLRPAPAGKPSDPVALDTGSNRIPVLVLAADTSAQYLITVERARPPKDTSKTAPGDTVKTPPGDSVKVPPADTGAAGKRPALGDWKHSGIVALRLPSAGSSPAGAIATDFPLLLRLTSANFRFTDAADSGRDLRFVDPDGRFLPYAIARWDTAAQEAEVYIRCDTLSPSRPAPVYYMYWGNPKAAAASDPAGVFPRSLGWSGVWHLEESGSGQSGEYRDATGAYPGTAGGGHPKRTEGVVGNAQDFDGNGSQGWISLPKEFDPGSNRYTLHMWVYREGRNASYLAIKSGFGADDQRFEIDLTQGTGIVGFGRSGTGGARYLAGFGAPAAAWLLLGIVCDGDSVHLYANGVEKEAHPFRPGGNPLSDVILGARNPQGDMGFPGRIDEFWSFSGARDAWYMRLLYENQMPGSSMATLTQY